MANSDASGYIPEVPQPRDYDSAITTMSQFSTNHARRISFLTVATLFFLMAWLRFTPILLIGLFSYFALVKLQFTKSKGRKWIAVALFLILVSTAFYALGFFVNEARKSLPEVAEKSIPKVIEWAKGYKMDLPFTDYESLKTFGVELARRQGRVLGSFAHGATMQLVFFVVGCLVAINLFINRQFELGRTVESKPENFYSLCCDEIAERFRLFFQSFSTVIGAQIAISTINTVLTSIFVLSVGFPHPVVIIGVTFLCGLLPVIGNLISNTIIIGIGFTISPKMALTALAFLVAIHKLEYFLNSKIIGGRIRNPIWLTLLGLLVGERLMGIPGMVLAPVILHYMKVEVSKIPITTPASQQPAPPKSPISG